MLPFARREKLHPEWVNTTAAIDRRRAAEGIARYQPGIPWDPTQSTELFEAMALVHPSYAEIARSLRNTQARFPSWTVILVHVLQQTPATQPASSPATRPAP